MESCNNWNIVGIFLNIVVRRLFVFASSHNYNHNSHNGPLNDHWLSVILNYSPSLKKIIICKLINSKVTDLNKPIVELVANCI
ncbi:unnamed protein product [Brugia pahangi]|uniref:Uncharacterized protein n=1 Tax=Brugia pahangi TaxID=6280 RepID=A0A0N4TI64_BRUPA|nr:unnamed protein product [Brugia pahangi]